LGRRPAHDTVLRRRRLGIYALVTRKADFTFALIMLLLVVVALASGADGVYRQLH
jgi:hypothetical protein